MLRFLESRDAASAENDIRGIDNEHSWRRRVGEKECRAAEPRFDDSNRPVATADFEASVRRVNAGRLQAQSGDRQLLRCRHVHDQHVADRNLDSGIRDDRQALAVEEDDIVPAPTDENDVAVVRSLYRRSKDVNLRSTDRGEDVGPAKIVISAMPMN